MRTQEEIITFMLTGKISLSPYDHGFFTNVKIAIDTSAPVTTGQVALLNRLIKKYSRQLRNAGFDYAQLLELPWDTTRIISTDPSVQYPKVSIQDNKLIVVTPYDAKFVSSPKSKELKQVFEWNRQTKRYEAAFSTQGLLLAAQIVGGWWKEVIFSDEVMHLIDDASRLDGMYDPTLIEKNGNYFIANHTPGLYEATKDIPLNNYPENLSKLVMHGVKISEEITKKNPFLEFSARYIPQVEYKDIDQAIDWLRHLDVAYAYVYVNTRENNLETLLRRYFITHKNNPYRYGTQMKEQDTDWDPARSVIFTRLPPTAIIETGKPFLKVIYLRDSRPVSVK